MRFSHRMAVFSHATAMNILQAIAERRSTRTFNGLRLESNLLDSIGRMCQERDSMIPGCIAEAFRATSLPSIVLLSDFEAEGKLGTYGVIKGARSFLVMSAGESPRSQMYGGFIMERIVLGCTEKGTGTCWLGGTFSHGGFQKAFEGAGGSGRVTIVCPVGHRTPKERFAGRMMRRIAASNTRKPFASLFTGIEAPTPDLFRKACGDATPIGTTDTESAVAIALECVRLAPSSTNTQPWRAAVRRDSKGKLSSINFRSEKNGALSAIDMGIAYCHFCMAAEALGIHGSFADNPESPLSLIFEIRQ